MQLAQVDIGKVWQLSGASGKGGFSTLGELASFLLPKALLIGGIIFFVMIVISGFNILTGAGSDDAAAKEKWHKILTYGAAGLVIMFSAYWILQIINFVTSGSLDKSSGGFL